MTADLIQSWSNHLRQDRRRSLHTVRAYVATAERLLAFLSDHQGGPPTLDGLQAADLRAFLARRRMDGIGNASAARELSAVRGFLTFAGGEESVPRLKGPRVKKGLPRAISPDEVMSLAEDVAEQAGDAWIAARDWAILLLLYGAGLRISEALALDVVDVDVDTGVLTLRHGKLGKERVLPVADTTRSQLVAYLRERDRLLGTAPAPFFVSDWGTRLSEWSARYNFATVCQSLGLRPAQKFHRYGRGPRIHDLCVFHASLPAVSREVCHLVHAKSATRRQRPSGLVGAERRTSRVRVLRDWSGGRQLGGPFPHGLSFQRDFVGVMDEPIQDGVG